MSSSKESQNKNHSVGITQIGTAIPEWFIKVEEIAKERNLPVDYVNGGLGLQAARIPFETSLADLLERAVRKINYQDVDRFFLGTESDYDLSKAQLALHSLNKRLGLSVVPFQVKFACLGGIQSLLMACDYVIANNKPAIVLVADRSLYGDKRAEVTQGCGAVAMRIERDPELLILRSELIGQYAEDIDDFKVPLDSAPLPRVDGPLTKIAFIKCVLEAFVDFKTKHPGEENLSENFDYLIMHTPFPKMVVWTAAALWRHAVDKDREFRKKLDRCVHSPDEFSPLKKSLDETREDKEFQEFFNQKVAPGLKYNPYIGNCYNASIFLSLISVLEQAKKKETIYITGYGSGAGSLSLVGEAFQEGYQSDLQKELDQGKELNEEQYLDWKKKTIKQIRGS